MFAVCVSPPCCNSWNEDVLGFVDKKSLCFLAALVDQSVVKWWASMMNFLATFGWLRNDFFFHCVFGVFSECVSQTNLEFYRSVLFSLIFFLQIHQCITAGFLIRKIAQKNIFLPTWWERKLRRDQMVSKLGIELGLEDKIAYLRYFMLISGISGVG